MVVMKPASFARNNVVFWAASLGVSILNYLYYPVLGRLMKPVAFGETQTIISFFTQLSTFFIVLGLVGVGIITKYADETKRDELTNEISRLTLYLAIFFFGLSLLFSTWLKHFFHFGSVGPFFLLGVSLLISVPASFTNSYLQGHKRFKALAGVNLTSALGKLILSVFLVELGFKTMGAIGGLVAAQLLALLVSLNKGRGLRHFVASNLKIQKPNFILLKPELPYGTMVLITSLTTNLFLSFDILVVKHYFPPAQAGLYTGISIISNIIYYLTVPFATVMIPSIRPGRSASQNRSTLKKSLLITSCTGGTALIIFLLLPHLVVLILLGHRYAIYASFLRGLAVSMFALSIANLLIYYHIGLRHFLVAPTVLVGLITTLILLSRRHASMNLVVSDLVLGALILLGLLAGLLLVYRRDGLWRQPKPL
jgi:O-antigen/teichoic acid export membrane protein